RHRRDHPAAASARARAPQIQPRRQGLHADGCARRSSPRHSRLIIFDRSTFDPKLIGIAKVTVGEPVQKAEASYAVKAGRNRGDAHRAEILVKSKCRDANSQVVDWEAAGVRAAKRNGKTRQTPTA